MFYLFIDDVTGCKLSMYFFKTEGEHEYLYRLEVAFGEDAEAEMIGVYVGEDAPKAEDSEK